MTRCFALLMIVLLPAATIPAYSQGTRADYERADKLRELTNNKVFRTGVRAHWFAENARFWYRNNLAGGAREFVLVDAEQGTRQAAFDHARLAKVLAETTGKEIDPAHLPFEFIEFLDDGKALRFAVGKQGYQCDLETYALSETEPPEEPRQDRSPGRRRRRGGRERSSPRSEKSPDGKWTATIKDHNVHLKNTETDEEIALSSDGTADDYYESRVYWSPDSAKLVALRTAKGEEHKVYLIESSPKDQQQPKLHSHNYRKPGDRIPRTKPHLFHVATKQQIPVSDELFSNPWRVSECRWAADSQRFTFLYNQRGHQVLRIVAVDAATGETGTVIDEQSETFLDYAYKQFSHYNDAGHEIIWMSERDGWNHLYLYDSRTGAVKNQLTKGEWVVRGVERVDEEQRHIWFRAAGVFPEQDPYYIHYCRVNFDGSGLVILTRGNGTHEVRFSPDRKFLVDTYSRVDMAPVTELRRAEDGALVCELERADMSALLKTGWQVPSGLPPKAATGKPAFTA